MRNYFAIFRKIIIFASWYSAICWICSHTLRGCVDWNTSQPTVPYDEGVTPFVGVWIETLNLAYRAMLPCHTLRGCVDWNNGTADINGSIIVSHPSWVCGLKPQGSRWRHQSRQVTPFVGVWIETPSKAEKVLKKEVTPFVGVWIETSDWFQRCWIQAVTPFVGVWIETHCSSMHQPWP